MAVMKGLEWTFDTVASTYEKFRPGYVANLYRAIFDYILSIKQVRSSRLVLVVDRQHYPFYRQGVS